MKYRSRILELLVVGLLALGGSGCAFVSALCKANPGLCSPAPPAPSPEPSPSASPVPIPEPSPSASPVPIPEPSPSASPTPTPSPSTAPGAVPPQRDDWEVSPGAPRYSAEVNAAMVSLTGCEPQSDCRFPHPTPEAWLLAVAAELRAAGLSAGLLRPGEDQIGVGASEAGPFDTYHVGNWGGNKVAWAPGCFQDVWSIPAPAVPAVDKFRLHVSHPDTYPRGRRVDATPLARSEAWCLSLGFLDADGSGQLWCPLGYEGDPATLERNRAAGPYTWTWTPAAPGEDADLSAQENPLQAWLNPRTARGTARLCAANGACSEVTL